MSDQQSDGLAESLARYANENSYLREKVKYNYEARRRLEAAIRRHASGMCRCKTAIQCVNTLARLVPVNPRPSYKYRTPK